MSPIYGRHALTHIGVTKFRHSRCWPITRSTNQIDCHIDARSGLEECRNAFAASGSTSDPAGELFIRRSPNLLYTGLRRLGDRFVAQGRGKDGERRVGSGKMVRDGTIRGMMERERRGVVPLQKIL